MDLEPRYTIHLNKQMALFVNDKLRFVHVKDSSVSTRIAEDEASLAEIEAWTINTLKIKAISLLQAARPEADASTRRYPLRLSQIEMELLENITTNAQGDLAIQREIDLQVQPHILEWRKWDYLPDGLPGFEPRSADPTRPDH